MDAKERVYVIDDDDGVRDSLAVQLDAAGYDVVTFGSAIGFLETATSAPLGCVVSDVQMPDIDGMELQKRLSDMQVNFPVVIMTGHADVALAVRAMKAGAVDFIEKPFSEQAILDSIRLREREVFDEMVRGKQNKVIAFDLNISPRTVEVHRARVLEKLEARSLSELVRLALAAGVSISS
jgi:two-component system, LuxR family, response regulator FixJ